MLKRFVWRLEIYITGKRFLGVLTESSDQDLVNFYVLQEQSQHPKEGSKKLNYEFYTVLFGTQPDDDVTSIIVRGVRVNFSPENIGQTFNIPLENPDKCWYWRRVKDDNKDLPINDDYMLNLLCVPKNKRRYSDNICIFKKAWLKPEVKLWVYFISRRI